MNGKRVFGQCFILCAAVAAGSLGCSKQPPHVWVHQLPPLSANAEAVIQARDTIFVEVKDQTPLSGEQMVREDGHYVQPAVGNIRLEGQTPGQAAATIAARLQGVVVDARVSVWIVRSAPIRVGVVGQVKTPGFYELTRDRGVLSALTSAGWLNEYASEDAVFVVRNGSTDPRIRFRVGDLTAPEKTSAQFRLRDGDVVVVE